MEWLKEILEKATLTEDGKLDVDAVISSAQKEFPKHAVPKTAFNDKVKELDTANKTIITLKKANGDNEDLQEKVGEYEKEIQRLRGEAEIMSKTYALKEQLSKSGVMDPDYLIYKHGGVEKFSFDKENRPVGVDDVLKAYKADTSMSYLFKEEQKKQSYNPESGVEGSMKNCFSKEHYNMTEQAKLLRTNPEQARALAAAAGVKI